MEGSLPSMEGKLIFHGTRHPSSLEDPFILTNFGPTLTIFSRIVLPLFRSGNPHSKVPGRRGASGDPSPPPLRGVRADPETCLRIDRVKGLHGGIGVQCEARPGGLFQAQCTVVPGNARRSRRDPKRRALDKQGYRENSQ